MSIVVEPPVEVDEPRVAAPGTGVGALVAVELSLDVGEMGCMLMPPFATVLLRTPTPNIPILAI